MKKIVFICSFLLIHQVCFPMEGRSEGSSSSGQLIPVQFNLTNGRKKDIKVSPAIVNKSARLTNLRKSVLEKKKNEEIDEEDIPLPILDEYPEQTVDEFEKLSNLIASGQTSSEELDKQLQQLSTDDLLAFIDLNSYLGISEIVTRSIVPITRLC